MSYYKICDLFLKECIIILNDIFSCLLFIEITDMLLTAQAFVFFVAGFETSSTTMSNAMYELALNPDIQNKLREEVRLTYKQNNGKLNYDCIKDMKYLDKVFKGESYQISVTLFFSVSVINI